MIYRGKYSVCVLALAIVICAGLEAGVAYGRNFSTHAAGSVCLNSSPMDLVLGAAIFSTGVDTEVEILASDADFIDEIYLCSPGPRRLLGTNKEVGKVVNLGRF